jgi:hypothetical protein
LNARTKINNDLIVSGDVVITGAIRDPFGRYIEWSSLDGSCPNTIDQFY